MTGMRPVDIEPLAAGIFTSEELATYRSAGYGRDASPGRRPALLIVDVTYAFTGDRNGSGAQYPLACGPAAWDAVDHIAGLAAVARSNGVPVIYSRNAPRPSAAEAGGWSSKLSSEPEAPRAHDVVDAIAPQPGDLIVTKSKPSAFFATPLVTWLVQLRVDTVLIAGGSTSGCVRATAVDAFSYNLNPFVVAEATFDRSGTSHRVNLFELNQKYATVVDVDAARMYLAAAPPTSPGIT
jgi:nicotinamidase-related amidase